MWDVYRLSDQTLVEIRVGPNTRGWKFAYEMVDGKPVEIHRENLLTPFPDWVANTRGVETLDMANEIELRRINGWRIGRGTERHGRPGAPPPEDPGGRGAEQPERPGGPPRGAGRGPWWQ